MPGGHRRGIFEGDVNPGMHPGGLGETGRDDFHAAGGMGDNGVFADGLADPADGQGFAAPLAGTMTHGKKFFPGHQARGVDIKFLAVGHSEFFHQPRTPYR